MADQKTVRCTRCAAEFCDAEIAKASACPACGSKSVPCAIAHDVTPTINWHELRILVMWAERWEENFTSTGSERDLASRGAVAAIAGRLMRFRPEGAPGLRFADDISELQDHFPGAEVRDAAGNVTTPARKIH